MKTAFYPFLDRLFPSVGSTNVTLIADLSRPEGVPTGTVYRAVDQTAGRGQVGRGWHSTPGDNLTLSVLARPDRLAVDRLFALNQVAGLAVANTVSEVLGEAAAVRLKWPNDVYVGDRKIAGVLVQNGLRGKHVGWSVWGIGLNVNEVNFPAELTTTAISLRLLTGRAHDLEAVQDRLFAALAAAHGLLEPGQRRELDRRYEQRLYRRGQDTAFTALTTGRRFRATVRGVDAGGRLLLSEAGGPPEAYALRELRWERN